jgi:hypothetical protein
MLRQFSFVVKGTAEDATEATQPYGLLGNPCDEDD